MELGLLLWACGCSSLLPKHNPYPDATIISPGFKLGYTFGHHQRESGFTWGLELTVPRKTWVNLHAIVAAGPAINFSWSPRAFQLRTGVELVSWFAGVEGGPAIVSDASGVHFGFGAGPWLGGIIVVPYMTHTFVVGGADITEGGSYFKLPLCPSCPSGGGHTHFDWDD